MHFYAGLKTATARHKAWIARGATGGRIAGVQFSLSRARVYVTGDLGADEIEKLGAESDVQISASTIPVPAEAKPVIRVPEPPKAQYASAPVVRQEEAPPTEDDAVDEDDEDEAQEPPTGGAEQPVQPQGIRRKGNRGHRR